jgi:hypothetical protein
MRKKILKILTSIIIVFFVFYLGVVISYNLFYYLEVRKEERFQQRREKAIKEFFMADTYGGKTPQETLNLFIEALKKGDIDLAVKYVKYTEREKAKKELEEIESKEMLDKALERLSKLELVPYSGEFAWMNDYYAQFILTNKDNLVTYSVGMEKNEYNNLWKITDF